ncbi:MAG: hypothetical protein R3302_10075, partial [Sulfurimonadaceae bacterium]|nr:hypothetical protein [Sulfurimonadaceae bacterium]
SLTAGTDNGDGSWDLGSDDLIGLQLVSETPIEEETPFVITTTVTEGEETTTSVVYEGNEDDGIIYDESVDFLDAGDGEDTLLIAEPVVDFTQIEGTIRNIENLELLPESPQSIKLGVDDVLDITGEDNTLTIMGGEGDEVIINQNEWTQSAETVNEGFTTYYGADDPTVTLHIQDDIDVGTDF